MKFSLTISLVLLCISGHDVDMYCSVRNMQGVCTKCWNAYLDSNNMCVVPVRKVANCLVYKQDGVCAECQRRYMVA